MDADITQVLEDWAGGDRAALDRLAPLVYPQLRDLARGLLRRERPDHTLQSTALVNELFLKLMNQRAPTFENRRVFYGACARLMRLALIDHARGAKRDKRGGGGEAVPLHEDMAWLDAAGPEVIDLDRLLTELSEKDPEAVSMFETRYLLGCTAEETAEVFGVSKPTVDRRIRLARAWLYQRLKGADGEVRAASD
ncbi:MAG: RNA polymerase subunit sigma-70 [Bryobacter sp.]|nr:RNA polymerase subunit sigma-70 [Bryobacter sp. CoA8 C33]